MHAHKHMRLKSTLIVTIDDKYAHVTIKPVMAMPIKVLVPLKLECYFRISISTFHGASTAGQNDSIIIES